MVCKLEGICSHGAGEADHSGPGSVLHKLARHAAENEFQPRARSRLTRVGVVAVHITKTALAIIGEYVVFARVSAVLHTVSC